MSQTIIIDLPDETKAALDNIVREDGVPQNELIQRALKDYLFVRQFTSLRERLIAQAAETYADQDVFDEVS